MTVNKLIKWDAISDSHSCRMCMYVCMYIYIYIKLYMMMMMISLVYLIVVAKISIILYMYIYMIIYDTHMCIISMSHYCNVEHLETTLQIHGF